MSCLPTLLSGLPQDVTAKQQLLHSHRSHVCLGSYYENFLNPLPEEAGEDSETTEKPAEEPSLSDDGHDSAYFPGSQIPQKASAVNITR